MVCEALLLFITVLFSLFNNVSYESGTIRLIESLLITLISVLFSLNFGFMIYVAISDCREKCRTKALARYREEKMNQIAAAR